MSSSISACRFGRTLDAAEISLRRFGITAIDRLEEGVIVHGSGTQLDQVVLNLLNNAVDAVAMSRIR